MAKAKQYTCIGCPIGCPLQLQHNGDEIKEISGHECDRGAKYARQEFTDPRRELSTTVVISDARWQRLPVKVTGAIGKDRVLEAARKNKIKRVVLSSSCAVYGDDPDIPKHENMNLRRPYGIV